MSWHFLERWLEKANQHSTLLGKFWITFLIVVRMVVVASIGDRVYNDEQSEFKCNTLQPGCTNVCFNKFSPMSHLRFWSFQILFVATPSVIYVVYSGHESKMKKQANKSKIRTSNDEDDDDGDAAEKQTSGAKRASMRHVSQTSADAKLRRENQRRASLLRTPASGVAQLSAADADASRKKHDPGGYEQVTKTRFDKLASNVGGESPSHATAAAVMNNFPHSTVIRLVNPVYDEPISVGHRGDSEQSSFCVPAPLQGDLQRHLAFKSCSGLRNYASSRDLMLNNSKTNENNNNCADGAFVWRKPCGGAKNSQADAHHDNVHDRPEPPTVWVSPAEEYATAQNMEQSPVYNSDAMQHGSRNMLNDRYMDMLSTHQVIPSAPPEYPGYPGNGHELPMMSLGAGKCPSRRQSMLKSTEKKQRLASDQSHQHNMDEADERKFSKKSRTHAKTHYPAFAQHFRWYLASVFLRLCMEVFFVVMQIKLYGFSVQELYKCKRWPCPNSVDCFISRPMEKTLFLWFMLVYSCICILLNTLELLYLIYTYMLKYSRKVKLRNESQDSARLNDSGPERHLLASRRGTWVKDHELAEGAGDAVEGGALVKRLYEKRPGKNKSSTRRAHHARLRDLWKYQDARHAHNKLDSSQSHEPSDYMYEEENEDDASDAGSQDRMAPDLMDDMINIEYNEMDFNDIQMDGMDDGGDDLGGGGDDL